MGAKKILVVDDEKNVGLSLRMSLEGLGYSVDICRSVGEFRSHPLRGVPTRTCWT
jgi:CheY-like chemotaxis protein